MMNLEVTKTILDLFTIPEKYIYVSLPKYISNRPSEKMHYIVKIIGSLPHCID